MVLAAARLVTDVRGPSSEALSAPDSDRPQGEALAGRTPRTRERCQPGGGLVGQDAEPAQEQLREVGARSGHGASL